MTAALAGDAVSTRGLVDRLLPIVRARARCALRRYKQAHAAEQQVDDLSQEVFLSLFEEDGRRLRAWDSSRGLSLDSFVGLMTERAVVGRLRRRRRNPWTEAPTDVESLVAYAGSTEGPEARVAEREFLDILLDEALCASSDRDAVLFQRLVVEEAQVDAVAREFGTTTGALYMWKNRFTKGLRDLASSLEGGVAPAARSSLSSAAEGKR